MFLNFSAGGGILKSWDSNCSTPDSSIQSPSSSIQSPSGSFGARNGYGYSSLRGEFDKMIIMYAIDFSPVNVKCQIKHISLFVIKNAKDLRFRKNTYLICSLSIYDLFAVDELVGWHLHVLACL